MAASKIGSDLMAGKTGIDIKLEGPLFDTIKSEKIMRQAVKNTVDNLIEIGEQKLDKTLRPRPGGVYLSIQEAQKGKASTGNYRRNVHGEVKRGMGTAAYVGKIHDSDVVYGPWLEGTSSRNKTTRFKGYQSFRKTQDWIEKTQARKILKKHVDRLTRRMNGK
jgi:hypothetical protein